MVVVILCLSLCPLAVSAVQISTTHEIRSLPHPGVDPSPGRTRRSSNIPLSKPAGSTVTEEGVRSCERI